MSPSRRGLFRTLAGAALACVAWPAADPTDRQLRPPAVGPAAALDRLLHSPAGTFEGPVRPAPETPAPPPDPREEYHRGEPVPAPRH